MCSAHPAASSFPNFPPVNGELRGSTLISPSAAVLFPLRVALPSCLLRCGPRTVNISSRATCTYGWVDDKKLTRLVLIFQRTKSGRWSTTTAPIRSESTVRRRRSPTRRTSSTAPRRNNSEPWCRIRNTASRRWPISAGDPDSSTHGVGWVPFSWRLTNQFTR